MTTEVAELRDPHLVAGRKALSCRARFAELNAVRNFSLRSRGTSTCVKRSPRNGLTQGCRRAPNEGLVCVALGLSGHKTVKKSSELSLNSLTGLGRALDYATAAQSPSLFGQS